MGKSERFDLGEERYAKPGLCTRPTIVVCIVVFCLSLTVGILIGHYGIEKTSDDEHVVGTTLPAVGGTTLPAVGGTTESGTTTPTNVETTEGRTTTPTNVETTEGRTTSPENVDTTVSGASTDSTPQEGVFLPGVPEAIVRDANLTVRDELLREINGTNIRENLKMLIESPHVAGTEKDFEQANMLKEFWLNEGLDVAVTTPYDILLSYPDASVPNLVRLYNLSDGEVVLESDANELNLTEEERPDEFPFPYLGYSGNGTVQGDIVYVNYARREDFEYLDTQNISVSGHIVLARYGRGGRSSKVRLSEENGAIGVILYSDPADYIAPWATDAYPDSIWIPKTATSRGSIFMGTGDPLTPGYPAIASAYRFNETDDEANLPKIPAMPISYDFAEKLFSRLGGPDAPNDWSGRLNVPTYKIGPGFNDTDLTAELSVHTTNQRKTSYNAFGMIRGETEPDRYVMLGNHRDSWVLGAIDPSSGTATMMELSRVMGNLVKEGGWRPRRSIIFCSWGAEEFGLIGSTEWIEENSKTLDFRSIAYINMDIAVTGNYSVRGLGSPPVFSAMYAAAKEVPNPNYNTASDYPTVYDEWMARKPVMDPETNANLGFPQINSPGAGSDYGTFQQRAGITCADFRYDQDFVGDQVLFYPLYHTSYETLHAVENLIDPGLELHATIGKVSGELLRDLADSKILPFNMSDYVTFLRHYTHRFEANASSEIDRYDLNMTDLNRVIQLYEDAAAGFHDAVNNINTYNPFDIRRVNDQMMQIERTFLDPAALNPGLEQLKRHLVHASTQYNAIPGASFPGLEDTIYNVRKEPNNVEYIRALQYHFSVLVFTIQGAANSLKDTTDFLREHL